MWKHIPAARIIQSVILCDVGSDQKKKKSWGRERELPKEEIFIMYHEAFWTSQTTGSRVGGGELDESWVFMLMLTQTDPGS